MICILFVCLGNICRSPMAEFVLRDLLQQQRLTDCVTVASAATSTEALGCDVHAGTKQKLREQGIAMERRQARQITRRDYVDYDHLIGMETRNITAMRRLWDDDPAGKVRRLLDFTQRPRDIADPWYTGNFDQTYDEIREGCAALLQGIQEKL